MMSLFLPILSDISPNFWDSKAFAVVKAAVKNPMYAIGPPKN
jgi:hypothetical protein